MVVDTLDRVDDTQDPQDEVVDEQQTGGWDSLKEEYKDHPAVQKYGDFGELLKGYDNLNKLVGLEKIALPKKPLEGATEEEIQAYEDQMGAIYGRLGRPEGADKYELDEEMAKELQIDEKALGIVKEVAYKNGMNNEQLKALVDTYGEIVKDQQKSFDEFKEVRIKENVETLRKEWGAAYDERVHTARKAYSSLVGDDKELKEMFDAGLGNDPAVIKMFHRIGSQLSEDSITGKGRPLTMTPDEAKRQIEAIKTDPKGPFWNDTHPEHEAIKSKVEGLYKMAYPEMVDVDTA